jgi:hypothetical protein
MMWSLDYSLIALSLVVLFNSNPTDLEHDPHFIVQLRLISFAKKLKQVNGFVPKRLKNNCTSPREERSKGLTGSLTPVAHYILYSLS